MKRELFCIVHSNNDILTEEIFDTWLEFVISIEPEESFANPYTSFKLFLALIVTYPRFAFRWNLYRHDVENDCVLLQWCPDAALLHLGGDELNDLQLLKYNPDTPISTWNVEEDFVYGGEISGGWYAVRVRWTSSIEGQHRFTVKFRTLPTRGGNGQWRWYVNGDEIANFPLSPNPTFIDYHYDRNYSIGDVVEFECRVNADASGTGYVRIEKFDFLPM
jgi:hypothetical protein